VHAAHADGLDCPIVGDAIYGSAGKRLMLHACSLSFVHPVSGNVVNVESDMEFKE
jgi:tRNA pseudouridine32 synthase/23S rRNA pseudouridine746 synthase